MQTDDPEIRIMAVGDIMLGMAYPASIANRDNIPSRLKNDQSSLVDDEITNYFKQADIVFGNLECVISKDFENQRRNSLLEKPKLMMAPLEAIAFLKDMGFDVLNITNNHMLDHGRDKVKETIRYLKENEIGHIGNPLQSDNQMHKISVKGKQIGFVGYNLCVKKKERMQKRIIKDVKEKKKAVDKILVSLHWGWGFEQMRNPAPTQVEFGRKLIDAGADIVLGHHSHVFQPVEKYQGKVIAYSLGNFIFDMWNKKNLKSGILDIKISKDNKINVDIIPVIQRNYQVNFDKEDSKIKNLISDKLNVKSNMKEYRMKKNKVKREHYNSFLKQYFYNFYKLPLEYHYFLISNWSSKVFNRITN